MCHMHFEWQAASSFWVVGSSANKMSSAPLGVVTAHREIWHALIFQVFEESEWSVTCSNVIG